MKAVEAYTDVRMVGRRGDAPGMAIVVDEAAQGQRLERHLDVVAVRQIAEPAQLIG